jgi:hypothetical protein
MPSPIQKNLAAWHPDIVGIYCTATLKRNAMRMAEGIRGLLRKPQPLQSTLHIVFSKLSLINNEQMAYPFGDEKLKRSPHRSSPLLRRESAAGRTPAGAAFGP